MCPFPSSFSAILTCYNCEIFLENRRILLKPFVCLASVVCLRLSFPQQWQTVDQPVDQPVDEGGVVDLVGEAVVEDGGVVVGAGEEGK